MEHNLSLSLSCVKQDLELLHCILHHAYTELHSDMDTEQPLIQPWLPFSPQSQFSAEASRKRHAGPTTQTAARPGRRPGTRR